MRYQEEVLDYKTNIMENNINYLIENGIATEEEITLVTKINGYTRETLNDILYARTGYRSFEQIQEKNGDE